MEESKEIKGLFSMLQALVYFSIIVEIIVMLYPGAPWLGKGGAVVAKAQRIAIYHNIFFSKLFTLALLMIVSIGTNAKKNLEINPKKQIVLPLFIGFLFFFGGVFFYYHNDKIFIAEGITLFDFFYMATAFLGAVIIHTGFDNISKLVKSGLGKDKWNTENESFQQATKPIVTDYSINIPMQFYFKKKVHDGYINIVNPFRGAMVIGTPGSGKTYSIIVPYIKQLLAKGFTMLVYDFKDPDLGEITYYHYLLNKKKGILKDYTFHAVNLNRIEKSRRINPLKPEYLTKLADATETAASLVEALRKGDKGGGSDQFFTQSAINFLTAVIYFLSRHEKGKYSTLAHVLAMLNRSYEEIFDALFTEIELTSLLDPFRSAYIRKTFDQLEGQLGTLKINISRLATKEAYWVFSGDDFDLKLSDPKKPAVVVLANDPATQDINSACYSVVLNRMTKLINSKHNKPSALIMDEIPTIYIHKIENLIATARSNKVAVLMGLQELPQFKQQYGKDTAQTIISVIGNMLSGSARDKETLDWMEKILGKVKQLSNSMSIDRNKTSVSMNEKIDFLIPASKIANLRAGEMVGIISQDAGDKFDGQYTTSAFNCKINLDDEQIKEETKKYIELPNFYNFGSDEKKEAILIKNYLKINNEVESIVKSFNVIK
ncbi:MAG: type IV secretory system conjugative DNA transfer family protein [Bacteroidota bacterium]